MENQNNVLLWMLRGNRMTATLREVHRARCLGYPLTTAQVLEALQSLEAEGLGTLRREKHGSVVFTRVPSKEETEGDPSPTADPLLQIRWLVLQTQSLMAGLMELRDDMTELREDLDAAREKVAAQKEG